MNNNITIHFSNLGPIKGPESVTLRPLMIFSGASSIGKSYLAMLVHYVYRIITGHELVKFLTDNKIDYDLLKTKMGHKDGLMYQICIQDFQEWVDSNALLYMRKLLGNPNFNATIHVEFPDLPPTFSFYYSVQTANTKNNGQTDSFGTIKFEEANDSISMLMGTNWGGYPFYTLLTNYFHLKYGINSDLERTFFMPPSRGSLIAVPDKTRLDIQNVMGMYQEFLSDLSYLKSRETNRKPSTNLKTAQLILQKEILQGDIIIKESELVYHVNTIDIPITAAASSIKEISPFALMIQKKVLGNYSVLFEEPESHLHPELQVKVAELMGYALQEGTHLQITTHSDYILRHLNDLIRLHLLKKLMTDEDFTSYCEKTRYNPNITINPLDVAAFYLFVDEHGNSIIKQQDTSKGIPFDTFEEVIKSQMGRSVDLYEQVEYYMEKEGENK